MRRDVVHQTLPRTDQSTLKKKRVHSFLGGGRTLPGCTFEPGDVNLAEIGTSMSAVVGTISKAPLGAVHVNEICAHSHSSADCSCT